MKDAAVSHLTLLLAIVMKLSGDVQNLMSEGRAASGTVASSMGRAVSEPVGSVVEAAASGPVASFLGRAASGPVASFLGRAASGPVASVMEAAASSTAAFFGDSESTLRNLLSRVEGVVEENKDLRQRLREQSERLTSVERRTVSLRNNSNEGGNTSPFPNSDPASTTQAEVARRLVNVENKAADHDILLVENNKIVEDVRRQNTFLQRQLELSQENVKRLERRVESQDHMLALRNVALADLEEYIRQQEVSSYDGILLWKISDFARRRSDAQGGRQTSFYSPSFYTSRHGYKMCARIYLNGDGMGKGTHISLFFVVMRGQYDGLLRWPFRQKVNLMILDQENIEHVTDAFRPDPNSSSFQRPRREMNIASGCPLFFPLSDLDKHAYVRDDTLFVKIIVDTSDL